MKLGKVCSLLGLGAIALSSAGQAEALTYNIFSNRTNWINSGVTVTGSENFNSISTDATFTNSTFNLPNLTLTSSIVRAVIDFSPYFSGATGIDGTTVLNIRGATSTGILTVTFPTAISAVGFDWENYDFDSDNFRIQVGADIVFDNNAVNGQKGFLGIVSTNGTFTSLQILRDPASTGADTQGSGLYNAFDNFEFGAASTPVPFEFNPAFGLMALGAGVLVKKKLAKKKK